MIEPHLKRTGLLALYCLSLVVPGVAVADGISGYAEYNYSLLDSKVTDAAGITKTKSSTLNQRYNLTMDKDLFPTLRLLAGANFELDKSDNDTNGLSTTSSLMRINPNIDLTYSNGIFTGGLGFSRRQESSKSNGVSSPVLFSDSYNTRFGWKPEDLPSLDVIYSVFNNYDENHGIQDSTNTSTILSSRYKPIDTLDMNYQANYSTLNSKLVGFESQSLNQSLRVSYSEILFNDRISVNSSYNIATQDSTTKSKTGFADELVSKTSDYYVRTDNIIFPITLSQQHIINDLTPALIPIASVIPSNLSLTFKSSGGTATPNYSDHLGMQFIDIPSINKVRVVVKPLYAAAGIISLPDALISLFNNTWKVFSSDNGTDWKPVPGVGIFTRVSPFNSSDGTEAIEASFPAISARYVKIVVTPVDLARLPVQLSNQVSSVSFSRLETYATKSIPSNGKSSSQISGLYNLNVKARLLSIPIVFYDASFNLDHTKSDTQAFTYRYTVVNGLSLNHRFNSTLSTSARLAREDTVDPAADSRSANIAGISLSSQTLPTLTQTFNYGYRQDTDAGITRKQHSLNLSNSADLYRGVSLSLSGGGSFLTDNTGADQKSLTVTTGLNMVPHKTLSINLSASDSRSWSTKADLPEIISATQTGDLSATFNPLPSIYLFGSYTINAQKNRKTQTTQSIGGSWSPFRGGALLFSTSYRENIDNSGNKNRTIVESLRWNIRSGWFLDVSYLIDMGTAASQTTDTQVFSTSLRLSF